MTFILERELFSQIKELFKLKNTEFIIDSTLEDSYCDKYTEGNDIICYLKTPEHAIHEGVHAFFAKRVRTLMKKLGDEEFWSREEGTLGDENLEEITARFVVANFQGKDIDICTEDIQKKVKSMSEEEWIYKDIELGKNIRRLYFSLYEFNCICPKDIMLHRNIKNDIDPIIIYNKLARYVGVRELID